MTSWHGGQTRLKITSTHAQQATIQAILTAQAPTQHWHPSECRHQLLKQATV